jgi:multiple sugar transport system substrate-binding protein
MKKVGMINPMRFRNDTKIIIGFLVFTITASCMPADHQLITPSASSTTSTSPTIDKIPDPTVTPTLDIRQVVPQKILPGTEILFWHAWSGDRANQIEKITEKFNDENEWGIQVIFESHADDSVLMNDINQAFEGGNAPDLIAAEPFALNLFSSQGFPVQDLTPFITSEQWGFSELEFNEIPLVFLKPDQVNGIQTGFPASRTGYVIFYNLSWARELGFNQIPSTIEEFRDQACASARANLNDNDAGNDGTGGLFYQSSSEALLSWMRSFGGDILANSGQEIVFDINENRLALEYVYDLYHADCAWVGREETPYRYFAERYAIFYSGRLQDIIVQTSYNQTVGSKDEWTVIPYPSNGSKPTMLVDGHSYGIIGEDPQRMLAAWIFVKYLLESENQIEQVEQYSEFPISVNVLDQIDYFKGNYPAWQQAVQLLPISVNIPALPEWGTVRSLLQDIADQLILFTTDKEEIPNLLYTADLIMKEYYQLP